VPERQEDNKPVSIGIAGFTGCNQQFSDFRLGQVLPDPVIGFQGIEAFNWTMLTTAVSLRFFDKLSAYMPVVIR
jgi:hypothetical protein